jgi:hypothetical protein
MLDSSIAFHLSCCQTSNDESTHSLIEKPILRPEKSKDLRRFIHEFDDVFIDDFLNSITGTFLVHLELAGDFGKWEISRLGLLIPRLNSLVYFGLENRNLQSLSLANILTALQEHIQIRYLKFESRLTQDTIHQLGTCLKSGKIAGITLAVSYSTLMLDF